MPIADLNHYNLRVPRALHAALVAFYVDVLGFEYRELPFGARKLYWLWVQGRPLVHLTLTDEDPAAVARDAAPAERVDHIAFSCQDLAAMRAHLEARGVAHVEKHYPEMGVTQVVVHDPAGLKIELNFSG